MEEKTDHIITQAEDKVVSTELLSSIFGGLCLTEAFARRYKSHARKSYRECSYCKKPCHRKAELCDPCDTQRYFGFLKRDINQFSKPYYRKATLSEIKEYRSFKTAL